MAEKERLMSEMTSRCWQRPGGLFAALALTAAVAAVAACGASSGNGGGGASTAQPAGAAATSQPAPARPSYDAVPLIPREKLFGNPTKVGPQLSPDGKRLAYIAPHEGVLNVFIKTVGQEDDKVVTADKLRGIRIYFWAASGDHILYLQDKGGDENWHVYAVPVAGGEARRSSRSSTSSPTRSWSASTTATRSCTTSTRSTSGPASAPWWRRTTSARSAGSRITSCACAGPRC
jgi:hypothetical protein